MERGIKGDVEQAAEGRWNNRGWRAMGVECSVSREGKEEVGAAEVVVGSGDGLVPRAKRL